MKEKQSTSPVGLSQCYTKPSIPTLKAYRLRQYSPSPLPQQNSQPLAVANLSHSPNPLPLPPLIPTPILRLSPRRARQNRIRILGIIIELPKRPLGIDNPLPTSWLSASPFLQPSPHS